MQVVDFYCGAGGLSAGAMLAGGEVTHGVDMSSLALRHWAANTGGKAVCREVVHCSEHNDGLPWPKP